MRRRNVRRRTRAACAVLGGVLAPLVLAGCGGGSVADSDVPDPDRRGTTRQTPFCGAAQANADAIRPLNDLIAHGQAQPRELEQTIATVRDAGTEMVRTAPEEIRPDVEVAVQAIALQLDALQNSGGDATALRRDSELAARLNSPEFTGPTERVRTYVARTCPRPTAG